MTRLVTTVLGACFAFGTQISPSAAQRITPILADALQQGGHVLVLRHTTAERIDEPSPMDLANCASQHRLTDKGRNEARALGEAFRTHKFPVGTVLSSGYCRTMETARLAFGHGESAETLLHPVYAPPPGVPLPPTYLQRTEQLKKLVATLPALGTNTVLVSHGENIRDALGFPLAFGETAIFRPDGQGETGLVGRVLVSGWAVGHSGLAGAQECLKTGCPAGERAVHAINQTPDGIAIQGYDPVAYYTEGRAVKGNTDFEYPWKGARWRFASAANRDRFAAHPEQYAPQHGGYCNMAMTRNQLTASDPNAWAVIDGKLRLFASARGRDNFQRNAAPNVELVARNWQDLRPAGLRGTLWVTNQEIDSVAKIDAATGKVLGIVSVGKRPIGLAAPKGTGKVYVSDETDNMVSVINKATLNVTTRIAVGPKPHHVHRSSDGRRVYVALFGTNKMAVIDTATDALVGEYATGPDAARAHAAWANGHGKTVWVTNSSVNRIAEIDALTGKILRTIEVGKNPSEVLVPRDGKRAYVSVRGANALQVVDLSKNAVIAEASVGTEPDTLSLSPDGRTMFIGLRGKPATAAVVDTASLTVRTVSLPGTTTGHNALSSDGRFAFIAIEGPPEPGVAVVDLQKLSIAAFYRYPGGGKPHGVIFEPADNGDNADR